MPTVSVKVVGLDKLTAKLNGIPPKVRAGISRAMTNTGARIMRRMATYPAQPSRTRAKTFNTYVRGVGSYPIAAFGGGKRLLRPGARTGKYGRVRYTSQQLGKKWIMSQSLSDKGLSVTVENTASYAGWVVGRGTVPYRQSQTTFHRATGWPVLEDVVDAELPKLVADCNGVIAEAIG